MSTGRLEKSHASRECLASVQPSRLILTILLSHLRFTGQVLKNVGCSFQKVVFVVVYIVFARRRHH